MDQPEAQLANATLRESFPMLDEEVPDSLITDQRAIVIGVGVYQFGHLPLANAPRDAVDLAELLKIEYDFHILPKDQPFIDKNASAAGIRSTLQDSLLTSDQNTQLLFYFAGHGIAKYDQPYLIPYDGKMDDPASWIDLSWVMQSCVSSACGEILIIIDSCYSGNALLRPENLSDWIVKGEAGLVIRQVIASGAPGQAVYDIGGSGHSVFTQVLLDALQGLTTTHKQDGSIPFSILLNYLVSEVPQRQAQWQFPFIQQPLGGNFYGKNRFGREFTFFPSAPRLSPSILQALQSQGVEQRIGGLDLLQDECSTSPRKQNYGIQFTRKHLNPNNEPACEVRVRAAQILGSFYGRESVLDRETLKALEAALDDVASVAYTAAQVLGNINSKSSAAALQNHVEHATGKLLLNLVAALGKIGPSEEFIKALRSCLRRGLLVPVLGPDLPQEMTGVPDRVSVINQLAKREGLRNPGGLADALEQSRRGSSSLYSAIRFLQSVWANKKPGNFFHVLNQLNLAFIINATYYDLVARFPEVNIKVDEQDILKGKGTEVLMLLGELNDFHGLILIEDDYDQMQKDERSRRLLREYLQDRLNGKVLLFIGHQPKSPDFTILVQRLLNKYLHDILLQPFIVTKEPSVEISLSGTPFVFLNSDPFELITQLTNVD